MTTIHLDVEFWPVIVTRPEHGKVTDAELERYLSDYRTAIRTRHERYVGVLDLRDNNSGITPAQRKMLTSAMQEDSASYSLCAGVAMVINSGLLRGMLTAILWIRKPPVTMEVFTSFDEAMEWSRAQLVGQRDAQR